MDAVAKYDEEEYDSQQYSTNDQENVVSDLKVVVDWVGVAGERQSGVSISSYVCSSYVPYRPVMSYVML